MAELTFREALRLRETLSLTFSEMAMLVSALDAEPFVTREQMCSYIKSSGSLTGKCFDVFLCRLNQKLPATIRIVPLYAEGRYAKGVKGMVGAYGYEVSSAWAREQLMAIARGEAVERAASAPSQERAA